MIWMPLLSHNEHLPRFLIEGGSSHIDRVKPDGTSRILGCSALLIDGAVAAFGCPFKRNCLPLRTTDGYAKRLSGETDLERALSTLPKDFDLGRAVPRVRSARGNYRGTDRRSSVSLALWPLLYRNSCSTVPLGSKSRRSTLGSSRNPYFL